MASIPQAVAQGLTENEHKAWDRLYYLTAIAGYSKQSINLVVSSTPLQMRDLPFGCRTRVQLLDEINTLCRVLEHGLTIGKYPTGAPDQDTEIIEITTDEREFILQEPSCAK